MGNHVWNYRRRADAIFSLALAGGNSLIGSRSITQRFGPKFTARNNTIMGSEDRLLGIRIQLDAAAYLRLDKNASASIWADGSD